jgi:hypothetical protein
MIELPSRRHFIAGLVGIIAAPAIVRASSLMPVKAFRLAPPQQGITECRTAILEEIAAAMRVPARYLVGGYTYEAYEP